MPVLFRYVQLLIGECLIQLISYDVDMYFPGKSRSFSFSARAPLFLFIFGRAMSFLFFLFRDREASKCEESSCLRMLLDKRDAWLGPWNPGRYLAPKSWSLFLSFCGLFAISWGVTLFFQSWTWLWLMMCTSLPTVVSF